jgi:DNA-binding beta-propeller fold protein YncE
MMRLSLAVLFLAGLFSAPALTQDKISPEAHANEKMLRSLYAGVPALPYKGVTLTPAVKLVGISAVAGDKDGSLYVIHRPQGPNDDPVVAIDRTGKFLRSWGHGLYKMPHGIRLDGQENIWTTDSSSSMVYKFSKNGKKLLEISVGDIPDPKRAVCGITDIAFSPTGNGHIYIADGYCNARVVEYDAEGRRVRQWGSHGTGPGEFNTVHGIAVGPDNNIYVADRQNGRIQWFDLSGKFLGQWRFAGSDIPALTFDKRGDLFITTHPKDMPLETENNIAKIDRATGKIMGRIDSRAHQLSAAPDGTLLPGTRDGTLVVFRLSE